MHRLFFSMAFIASTLIPCASRGASVKVVFDTDIGPDVDDVGAVAVLHALADQGEVDILAMMASAGGYSAKWGPPCLDALNTYYGRPDIPLGVVRKASNDAYSLFSRQVAEASSHDAKDGINVFEATTLYRQILAAQPDHSVVIVSVGFLTNLRHLLASPPDIYSPLNGEQLVAQKVRSWSCMGGKYPSGREFNFFRDTEATLHVVPNWPRPVVFSGAEIGSVIETGARLATETPQNSPVRHAYQLYTGGEDRPSWDQTAVLHAVRGLSTYWDAESTGGCNVLDDGSNRWEASPDLDHAYLLAKASTSTMKQTIEDLMVRPPNGAVGQAPEFVQQPMPLSVSEGDPTRFMVNAKGDAPMTYQWQRDGKAISGATNWMYTLDDPAFSDSGAQISCVVSNAAGSVTSAAATLTVNPTDWASGLAAYWRFDEKLGTHAQDDSDNDNHAALVGFTPEAWVDGAPPVGFANPGALAFDGSGAHAEAPSDSATLGLSDMTLAAWVMVADPVPDGWRVIVEHGRESQNWYGLYTRAGSSESGVFHFRWSDAERADFTTAIRPGEWHHVAGVVDGAKKTAFTYLDGKLDGSHPVADPPVPTKGPTRVGLNGSGSESFVGRIDELRIYNRPLSGGQIAALAAGGGDTDPPVLPQDGGLTDAQADDGGMGDGGMGDGGEDGQITNDARGDSAVDAKTSPNHAVGSGGCGCIAAKRSQGPTALLVVLFALAFMRRRQNAFPLISTR